MAPQVSPEAISSPAEFSAALASLRQAQGKAIRALARETGIPSATLGGYFSGRHLPAATQPEQLDRLMRALGVPDEDLPGWREALLRVRRAPGPRQPNPYRGLESYDLDDADLFFGRDELTATIRGNVLDAARTGRRWVTLVGASGSGKSSLLRAGVLAGLRAEGRDVAVVTPSSVAPEALAAIAETMDEGGVLGIDQFEELFSPRLDPAERREMIVALVDAAAGTAGGPGVTVVVAVRADHFGRCVEEPLLLPLMRERQFLVGPIGEQDLAAVVTGPARERGREVEPELVTLVQRDADGPGASGPVLPLVSHALRVMWDRTAGPLTAADYLATGGIAGAIATTTEQVWDGLSAGERAATRRVFRQLATIDEVGRVTRRRVPMAAFAGPDERSVVEAFIAQRILVATSAGVEVSHEVVFSAWPRLRAWLDEDEDALRVVHRIAVASETWEAHSEPRSELLRGAMLDMAAQVTSPAHPAVVTLTDPQQRFLDASLADRARRRRRATAVRGLLALLGVGVLALAIVASILAIHLHQTAEEARRERTDADTARDQALSRQVALEARDLESSDVPLARELALAAYRISPTLEARSALLEGSSLPVTTRVAGVPGAMRAVYSPDGKLIAVAAADGRVRIYRPGEVPQQIAEVTAAADSGELYAAAFSADGRLLAVGGAGGIVTVFDLTDPTAPVAWPAPLTGPKGAVEGLRFDAAGTELAAAASDPAVYRWRLGARSARVLPTTTQAFGGSVQSVDYGSGGLVATGSSDGYVRLWHEGVSGPLRLLQQLRVGADSDYVYAVDISPDGTHLAAGDKDSSVHVWALHGTGAGVRASVAHAPLTGFPSWVNSIAYSPDGSLLAAGGSGAAAMVWSTRSYAPVAQFAGPSNFTSIDVAASDDEVVTGAIDGTLRVVRLRAASPPAYGDTIWSLTYDGTGRHLYVGVGAAAPEIVPLSTGSALAPRPVGHAYRYATLDGAGAEAPDGSEFVAGTSSGDLVVFRTAAGAPATPVRVLHTATELTENVSFSPDGRWFAAASDDGYVTVYAADHPGAAYAHIDVGSLPLGLTFAPGGDLLAVATAHGEVKLYRVAPHAPLVTTVAGFDNYAYAIAFTPDGRTMAAAGADKTVRLWDISDPSAPVGLGEPLRGPGNTLYSLAFSADGSLLGGASSDDSVWLWSMGSAGSAPAVYARLANLGGHAYSMAFDPRGGVVAGGGGLGQVALWGTDPDTVAAGICASVGSPITPDEWSEYVPGEPYADPCG